MSRLQPPFSRWLHINRSYPIPLCSAMHQEYLQTAAHPIIPLHVLSLPSKLKSYSHAKPVSKYPAVRATLDSLVQKHLSVRLLRCPSAPFLTAVLVHTTSHAVRCNHQKFPAHPPVAQHLPPEILGFAVREERIVVVPACFIIRFERAEADTCASLLRSFALTFAFLLSAAFIVYPCSCCIPLLHYAADALSRVALTRCLASLSASSTCSIPDYV